MFFLLRVLIIVGVLFYLSPVRTGEDGRAIEASGAAALAGASSLPLARWWTALPQPVRDGMAADALARFSKGPGPAARRPAETEGALAPARGPGGR